MASEVKLVFAGDSSRLERSFENVSSSSSRMVGKINEQSDAHTRLGERIGNQEQKLVGTADLLDGLGGAFGLPTEGATSLFRAFGDLSGGFEIVSSIVPGLSGLFPKLAGAMTFVSAHPLIIGLLAGGAIIAGLIFLEKRFGLVSSAVEGMGDALGWVWQNAVKPAINGMIGGVELLLKAWTAPLRLIGAISSRFGGPDFGSLTNVQLPRLDVGGTVLETGLAVVHRGEVVNPATGGLPGGGGGLTVNVYVGGHVTSDRALVDAIHAGLLRKQNRTSLGFRAA